MRFVFAENLKEGMTLGNRIIDNSGNLLLQEGTVLTSSHISQINKLQFNGVYINDKISEGIDIKPIIKEETKEKALNELRQIEQKFSVKESQNETFGKVIADIVTEISNSPKLMVSMHDIKSFDEYTYYHSVNVTVLSLVLGCAMGLDTERLYELAHSAMFHDIGKILVDNAIINKEGKLTPGERRKIEMHPAFACKYLEENGFALSPNIKAGILDHHEWYNGSGYPENRKKQNISLNGRIIAVADVYDALTSDRPYRKALSPSEALEYIMAQTSTQFDPDIVKVFSRKIIPYPIGSCVQLSTGEHAIVIDADSGTGQRPVVRIYQKEGAMLENPRVIDLMDRTNMNITIVGLAESDTAKYMENAK